MNAPLTASSFLRAIDLPLTRPEHLRIAAPPARDRAAGAAIAVAVPVAVALVLVLGFHVARAPVAPRPMMIDIVQPKKTPDEMKVALPKFVPPAQIFAPAPVIDIAPNPTAITVAPPKAVQPAPQSPPSPAARDTGEGRATYLGLLLAQLNRVKHYPPEAKSARIEGVAMLHFVIDRSGKLLSAEIARSSGRPVLDREALALIARAAPLPAMPADMAGDTLDAVVPISFSLH